MALIVNERLKQNYVFVCSAFATLIVGLVYPQNYNRERTIIQCKRYLLLFRWSYERVTKVHDTRPNRQSVAAFLFVSCHFLGEIHLAFI